MTLSTVAKNNCVWLFEESDPLPVIAEKILTLQKNEPCLQSLQNSACPSDLNGQVAFICQQGQAINFYREILTLFSIYVKQDVLSPSRRNDFLQAERVYGNKIRTITRQMNALITEHHSKLLSVPLGAGWQRFILGRATSKSTVNHELIACQKKEKTYQQKYFEAVASICLNADECAADQLHTVPRDARKKKWLAENEPWKALSPKLDSIVDGLLQCRHDLAQASGLDNYTQLLESRNRSVGIPVSLAQDISKPCRALLHDIHLERKRTLKVKQLRPFDMTTRNMQVFKNIEEWVEKTGKMLWRIHPYLACGFNKLISEGLCDLRPRRGKTAESFCQQLPHSKKAYIFLSMQGGRRDVMSGIHEVGHALHISLSFKKFNHFFEYKVNPATSEFFALTLELLSLQYLSEYFHNVLSTQWAKKKSLESILNVFTTYITLEMFEKNIYSKSMTAFERKRLFAEIISDNLGLIDYSGYEENLELWSYRIPLLVSSPGYFANYAYTQLGALFFAHRMLRGEVSVDEYLFLMQDKGTASIGEIYETIGFHPTHETVRNVFGMLSDFFKLPCHSIKPS